MRSIKNKLIPVAFSATTFLASCSSLVNSLPVYYTPAATSNHMSYLPKPMMSDSAKVKNYISGSFANNTLPYDTGDMAMGYLNYSRAHVLKHINLAYGGFTYFGGTTGGNENSKRKVNDNYHGKGFFGLGFRTSVGIAQSLGNTEFRILNWENALVYETGSYSKFRKDLRAKLDPLELASNKTTMFTTGGSTEIIWSGSKNKDRQYGFRFFLGTTIGLQKNINYTTEKISGLAADFSFFIKIKNVYGILGSGTNLMNNSGKITLGYAF